ncbi:Cys-tRNA(Pro) deacylase [Anaerovorax odorimutans]|uniref:Cys-tRNA(Pro)/Cys-tRNA(Cys) deacylase n=1 Tax=Anaerovorax odorimutans TaxID=109327 RepID=A0ABT1RRL7_9FIRM|nr:Cys-tRNA(Pro) deacylase [Anaerovorax odorimutans]MCQ4637526.1 Cys-tRNA(Pro) deacylase [Anaerovorax odorimutans]
MSRGKQKTNAVRIIEAKKIPYEVYEYDAPDGFLDGVSVARATGMPLEKVFKTLVLQGSSREYYVCVIPVAKELDLKKAARHFKEKKIEMIPARDITRVTGYIKGGCSPVGMKKLFKTAVDQSAAHQEKIIVSAGKVGLQMEVPLEPLLKTVAAELADLTD